MIVLKDILQVLLNVFKSVETVLDFKINNVMMVILMMEMAALVNVLLKIIIYAKGMVRNPINV